MPEMRDTDGIDQERMLHKNMGMPEQGLPMADAI